MKGTRFILCTIHWYSASGFLPAQSSPLWVQTTCWAHSWRNISALHYHPSIAQGSHLPTFLHSEFIVLTLFIYSALLYSNPRTLELQHPSERQGQLQSSSLPAGIYDTIQPWSCQIRCSHQKFLLHNNNLKSSCLVSPVFLKTFGRQPRITGTRDNCIFAPCHMEEFAWLKDVKERLENECKDFSMLSGCLYQWWPISRSFFATWSVLPQLLNAHCLISICGQVDTNYDHILPVDVE